MTTGLEGLSACPWHRALVERTGIEPVYSGSQPLLCIQSSYVLISRTTRVEKFDFCRCKPFSICSSVSDRSWTCLHQFRKLRHNPLYHGDINTARGDNGTITITYTLNSPLFSLLVSYWWTSPLWYCPDFDMMYVNLQPFAFTQLDRWKSQAVVPSGFSSLGNLQPSNKPF